MWKAHGIEPCAVLGHSVGHTAAASRLRLCNFVTAELQKNEASMPLLSWRVSSSARMPHAWWRSVAV